MTIHALLTNLLTDSPAVRRVAATLAHTVWQGLLAAALLRLAMAAVGDRPRVRYVAACVALSAVVGAAAVTFAVVGETAERADRNAVPGLAGAAAPPPSPVAAPPLPAASGRPSAVALLVLTWAAGVAGQAVWHAAGWTRVRRLGREPAVVDARWTAALATAADRVGVRRAVRLLASARVDVPVVLGVLRPAVVVPLSLLTELPADHVEAVLAHELAHVRRHDYLVNLAQCGVEAIFFYHPAVWWMSAVARREREHCCDDVAAAAVGSRPAVAAALVAVEGRRGPRLAAAATGGSLPARVRRLVGRPAGPQPRWPAGVGVAVAVAVALLVTLHRHAGAAAAQTGPTTAPADPRLRDAKLQGLTAADPPPFPPASDPRGGGPDPSADPELQHLIERRKWYADALQAALKDPDAILVGEAARVQEQLDKVEAQIEQRTRGRPWAAADPTDVFTGVVYVGGDVARPGVYSITGPRRIAVSRMVISAGDVDVEHGAAAWVTVVRRANGRQTRVVDGAAFASLLDGTAADPELQAGDVVRVSTVNPAMRAAATPEGGGRPGVSAAAAGAGPLGPGDRVRITVPFLEPGDSPDVDTILDQDVAADGTVKCRVLVERVKVAGLTEAGAASEIAARYAKANIFRHAAVTVARLTRLPATPPTR